MDDLPTTAELNAELDPELDARAASQSPARARPTIYFSVSGGIGDWEAYAPDGHIIRPQDMPVVVIHIDWDSVEGETPDEADEEYSSTNIARAWLEDPEVPERVRKDIEVNLEGARRWDAIDGND